MQGLSQVWRDLRHAGRQIRREPGFAAAIVGTLALGIGANTAIASVVKAVLLRPVPYVDAERLVYIVEGARADGRTTSPPLVALDAHQLFELRRNAQTLSHVVAYGLATLTLTGRGEPIRIDGASVSPETFGMLGVGPLVGRTLNDDDADSATVVLLSESLWRRHFDADTHIVGRVVMLEGRPRAVVGVMPAGFAFPDAGTQFWLTLHGTGGNSGMRPPRYPVIARVRDGVAVMTAQAEVNAILLALGVERGAAAPVGGRSPAPAPGAASRSSSPRDSAPRFQLVGVVDELVRPVRPAVLLLSVAVGFVLLIACVNAAHLLLARTARREPEIATRLAIGASRADVVRQVLSESIGLALIAAAAGVALAHVLLRVLRTLAATSSRSDLAAPVTVPNLSNAGLDASVLLVTTLVAVSTGVLFGAVPALHASTQRPIDVVRQGATTGSRRRQTVQNVLVVLQITMATLLCISAGLLTRSFVSLAYVHPGYDPSNVLTFQIGLPGGSRIQPVAESLAARLRATPGVEDVGYTRHLPMTRSRSLVPFRTSPELPAEAAPPPAPPGTVNPPQWPDTRHVSRDYLRALRIRLVQGRGFDERDRAGTQQVLLINETLARSGLLGPQPVGRYVYALGLAPWEVVGVVADVKQSGLDYDPGPQVFIDLRQLPGSTTLQGTMDFVVRASEPASLAPAVRRLLAETAPSATVGNVTTLDDVVSDSIARPRLYAVLMGLFAASAMVLAAVGIHGVMSYVVTLRTSEIGIRMALGADRAGIVGLVASRAAAWIGLGIAGGLLGAAAVSRALQSLLFGVGAADAPVYGIAAGLVALCGATACLAPVRRATRVDPLRAIRAA